MARFHNRYKSNFLRARPGGQLVKCLALLLVAFVSVLNVNAQAYFHFTRDQKREAIPFKFYRNLIVVPVFLNGQGPFNFVLDTGVGVSTITDPSLEGLLNIQRGRKIVIRGLGESEGSDAFLTSSVFMSMPGIESLPLTMVMFEKDPFFLSTYLGFKVHGILGYEFFSSFAVKINYIENVLTVFPAGSYRARKSFSAIPIEIKANKPFFQAECHLEQDSLIEVDLLIDTGAGFPLSLQTYTDPRIRIPARHLETQLGLGLNGIINGSLARASSLKIASFTFNHIVTAFPDHDDWGNKTEPVKRNGSIGNFLLKRFFVVFDYAAGKMYLKPNSRMEDPFEYDRVGIELVGGGDEYDHFIVYQVKSYSPAAEAGILPDDEVLEVNFQKAKDLDLGSIDKILSNPNSKGVTLKLRRGDDYLYVLLRMRDLI